MKLTQEQLQMFRDVRIHRILNVIDNGRDTRMACPIHKGKNDNFELYPDNSYHCFKCNANGRGALDFCRDLGLNFKDSLEELANYIIV